jgi:site-specific DNA recombinase
MNAAVYCRVSTDEQKENTSLDGQEAACKRYAELGGMDVYQVYRDDYTGSRIDRPELQGMLADMRAGCFQAVIVNEVSRWGRDERVYLN